MWMIRWFFIALIMGIIILFIVKNGNLEPFSIDYVFGETEDMSPLTALFLAYVFGFITWFVISLLNFLKMRAEIASKNKLIKNLKDELNNYRGAALSNVEDVDQTIVMGAKKFPAAAGPDGDTQ